MCWTISADIKIILHKHILGFKHYYKSVTKKLKDKQNKNYDLWEQLSLWEGCQVSGMLYPNIPYI